MKSIGGYFSLELNFGNEYHQGGIRLNTGRNALEYILLARKYEKVYLPYYTCDVLLEPIKKLRLSYEFYFIDENFEPIFNFFSIKKKECFIYTNFFGLKGDFISKLVKNCPNLIIDNAQAFYAKPLSNIDTFYSARKFFGVPDGSYLFTNKILEVDLEQDFSHQRCEHLLRRLDTSAENGYKYFSRNESLLSNQAILRMSRLTKSLLQSVNYIEVASKRRNNFNYLDKCLKAENLISFPLNNNQVPLTYPFLTTNCTLRKKLIQYKIYTPQYWSNVLEWTNQKTIEYQYAKNIIHMPIDQRYSPRILKKVLNLILN